MKLPELPNRANVEDLFSIKVYREHLNFLESIDLSKINTEEEEQLKQHLGAVLHFALLMVGDITIPHLYRVTVNERVINKRARINEIKYLTYPTLDIVQRIEVNTIVRTLPKKRFFMLHLNQQ